MVIGENEDNNYKGMRHSVDSKEYKRSFHHAPIFSKNTKKLIIKHKYYEDEGLYCKSTITNLSVG